MLKESDKKKKSLIRIFLTGFAMGSADIVPGVSGGTIAFIAGIYEELIYSIKKVSGKTLKFFLSGKIKESFLSIPYSFLIPLFTGLLLAVFTLAKLLSYLLTAYPVLLWAFFFGLVAASSFIVRKRVVSWKGADYTALIISTIVAFIIVGAVPVETPNNYATIFLSGMIAITAMILPGISGSFLLIIMGKYHQILQAVVDKDIISLGLFGIGTVVGLGLFSRIISWLFERHHDLTISILTGLMIGSLRKVWPWKDTLLTRINSHGQEIPIVQKNILPLINTQLLLALFLMLIGAGFVLYLDTINAVKEHVRDIQDSSFEQKHKKTLKSQK